MVLVVAEGLALALVLVLIAGLLRSHAEILRKLHELGAGEAHDHAAVRARRAVSLPAPSPAGRRAADIVGTRPAGGAAQVGVVAANQATLLAFLTTGCTACRPFWRTFASGVDLPAAWGRLVIVTKDPSEESPTLVQDLAPGGLTTVMSSQAWVDYGIPVSPYFVLVDGQSGRVLGEGAAASWQQVSSLLGQAVADAEAAAHPSQRGRRGREQRVDRELIAAGIEPGHPSLYGRHQRKEDS